MPRTSVWCAAILAEASPCADDADLAFEYSSVQATVKGHIVSVKNPRSGYIKAGSIGEVILDENAKAPANCQISCDK